MLDYFEYWGKFVPDESGKDVFHRLVFHSLDVAAVASVMLNRDSEFRSGFASAQRICESSENVSGGMQPYRQTENVDIST